MKNPERYMNRIVSFSQEMGLVKPKSSTQRQSILQQSRSSKTKTTKRGLEEDNETPKIFMSKFQKEINSFNAEIAKRDDWGNGPELFKVGETTLEKEKRMFNLPKSKSQYLKRRMRYQPQKAAKAQQNSNLDFRRSAQNFRSVNPEAKFSIVGNDIIKMGNKAAKKGRQVGKSLGVRKDFLLNNRKYAVKMNNLISANQVKAQKSGTIGSGSGKSGISRNMSSHQSRRSQKQSMNQSKKDKIKGLPLPLPL